MLSQSPALLSSSHQRCSAASLCRIWVGAMLHLQGKTPSLGVSGVTLGFWGQEGEQEAAHTAGPCCRDWICPEVPQTLRKFRATSGLSWCRSLPLKATDNYKQQLPQRGALQRESSRRSRLRARGFPSSSLAWHSPDCRPLPLVLDPLPEPFS